MDQALFEEQRYLSDTIALAKEEIRQLHKKAAALEKSILEAKEEMRGETSQSIGNLSRSDSFEQLVELSQFATQISMEIDAYEATMKDITRHEKLLSAPYFARIDFQRVTDAVPRPVYIGRGTLMREYDIYVYDWRAPISSLFYRFGPGPAAYEAPVGKIEGIITKKRQYEIKDGELLYYFDADIEILDEYLRRMLSQNASTKMKSIVETIQREQDAAIRDVSHDVLLVQGVAGSGKTSIAMHRIAYLLYHSHTLTKENVLILSPNPVFETYIAGVLPELGEENVRSLVLDEVFELLLGLSRIQTRHQFLEAILRDDSGLAQVMKHSLMFKCSLDFQKLMDKLPSRGNTVQTILAAYTRLFADRKLFRRLTRGMALPEDIDEIIAYTNENLGSSTLFFDDASALSYLTQKNMGSEGFRNIRQVVVDEVQDYYPLQLALLQSLFPNAQFTLLGDVAQTIEKPETLAFYQTVLGIFNKKSAFINLTKSFRCSNGIIRFCSGILGTDIAAFGREGEAPAVLEVDAEGAMQALVQEIEDAKAAGYQSIAILCKSNRDCQRLAEKLCGLTDARVITDTTGEALTGVFLLPIYLAKGLEFDAVFIWDANQQQYCSEDDRALLFVGCTRALHRLRVFFERTASVFLPLA